MPRTIRGIVKGDVIVPEDSGDLLEGASVVINLPSKALWLKHAGIWHDRNGLDEMVEEIYSSRTIREKDPTS